MKLIVIVSLRVAIKFPFSFVAPVWIDVMIVANDDFVGRRVIMNKSQLSRQHGHEPMTTTITKLIKLSHTGHT